MAEFPASHRDLIEAPGTAVLVTNGASGYPQVTAVAYFLDDDGELKVSLNATRQKTKNLQANPKCTLFFLDPNNQYRTLEIRANAHLEPDAGFAFAAKAGSRYGTDFHIHDNPGEERVIVTLEPTRINVFGS